MNNALLETISVFAKLARPGDTVDADLATGQHRTYLMRLLSRRGLTVEFDGEYTVAATVAWTGR